MTDKLKQIIKEGLVNLPKESQEVINSFDWATISEEIGKKYLLTTDETSQLQTEIALVLLEIVDDDLLSLNIEDRIGTSRNEAEKITEEINQKILNPMIEKREALLSPQPKPFVPTPTATPAPVVNPAPVFDQRFIDMPKNVQDAISKSGWREKVYALAKKYSLNIEQSGLLEEVTVKFMQNVIHPNQYESELFSKMQTVSKENISSLAGEVNESILKTIRELMQGGKPSISDQLPISNSKEVPVPPYKNIIKNEVPVAQKPISPVIETPKPVDPIKEVINGIKMPNIMEEKLKSAVASDHTVSDYSTPKISSPASTVIQNQSQIPRSSDPYRETF